MFRLRKSNHRTITERDLNAITERDVRVGCWSWPGTSRGPSALHAGCILCFLSIPLCVLGR